MCNPAHRISFQHEITLANWRKPLNLGGFLKFEYGVKKGRNTTLALYSDHRFANNNDHKMPPVNFD
jgi:hypothetical protein